MKIKNIRALAITDSIAGGTYHARQEQDTARRPPWTKDAEVANPMSRYPRYKALRSSWLGNMPAVGCLVTASDGTWGFGVSRYGSPVIAVVNEHLGPLLVGEPALLPVHEGTQFLRGQMPRGVLREHCQDLVVGLRQP